MATNGGKPGELDVMALLNEVHGTQEGARDEAMQVAVHTLEATHRRASLAMRHFEQAGHRGAPRGRQTQEGSSLPDLAADGPGAPAEGRHDAGVDRGGDEAAQAPQAGSYARAQEVTAVWRRSTDPGAAPTGPADARSLPPPTPNGEATQTTHVGAAPAEGRAQAANVGVAEAPQGAATAPKAEAAPERVYRGQGAQVVLREPTRTQVVLRPKK